MMLYMCNINYEDPDNRKRRRLPAMRHKGPDKRYRNFFDLTTNNY